MIWKLIFTAFLKVWKMQNKIFINYLLDFYGILLTRKQQAICKLYYVEDCSLSEISEMEEISRNAVFDTLKRSEQILLNYEEKLNCYNAYLKRSELYGQIKEKNIDEINELIDKLIETEIKEDKYE